MHCGDLSRSFALREVRKVGLAVAMSAANYGIEAMWTRQPWLLKGFDKLPATIARAVAGAFFTAKAKLQSGRQTSPPGRKLLLLSTLASSESTPRRLLLPASADDDSDTHSRPSSKWLQIASRSGALVKAAHKVKHIAPAVRRYSA